MFTREWSADSRGGAAAFARAGQAASSTRASAVLRMPAVMVRARARPALPTAGVAAGAHELRARALRRHDAHGEAAARKALQRHALDAAAAATQLQLAVHEHRDLHDARPLGVVELEAELPPVDACRRAPRERPVGGPAG